MSLFMVAHRQLNIHGMKFNFFYLKIYLFLLYMCWCFNLNICTCTTCETGTPNRVS